MSSSHLPKNTEVGIFPDNKHAKAEIFWHTQNVTHILDSYMQVAPRGTARTHDLKFNEISNLMQGKTLWLRTKRKPPFVVLAKRGDKIYQVIVNLENRKDARDTLFAVIVSCYICTNPEYINYFNRYENYEYGRKS